MSNMWVTMGLVAIGFGLVCLRYALKIRRIKAIYEAKLDDAWKFVDENS